jgi:hypothetical protein
MPGCIRHQAAPMDEAENAGRTILLSICPSDLSRRSINVGELRPTISAVWAPSLDEARCLLYRQDTVPLTGSGSGFFHL